MALSDVYDALISKRIYNPLVSHQRAVAAIKRGSDHQFDPVVVDAFLKVKDDFRSIALKFADFKEEKKVLMKTL